MLAVVLDEAGLKTAAPLAQYPDLFGSLVDLLEELRGDGISRLKHSNVYATEIAGDTTLAELLFDRRYDGILSPELRRLLQVAVDRLADWDLAHADQTSRDFAIRQCSAQRPHACAVLKGQATIIAGNPRLHLVTDHSEKIRFYRDAIEIGDFNQGCFMRCARLAFPNLVFRDGIENDLRLFSQTYRLIRAELTVALSHLNDTLLPLVVEGVSGAELSARFSAVSGFGFSPESSMTHKMHSAMSERDVYFGRDLVRCEWHLKMKPNRDRIHVNFDSAARTRKIMVGIFTEHLTTFAG